MSYGWSSDKKAGKVGMCIGGAERDDLIASISCCCDGASGVWRFGVWTGAVLLSTGTWEE